MSVNKVNSDGSLLRVAGGTLYADSPIGTIVPFGGLDDKIPSGWLKCNGQAVSRTTYSELFAVISTSFGTGDGSTTFNIPDLRETVPVGYGLNTGNSSIADHDAYTIGEFKDDQLQDHTHKELVDQAAGNVISVKGVSANANEGILFTGNIKTGRKGTTTHGKQLGVNYIIKAKMVALPADLASGVEEYFNSLIQVKNISYLSNSYYDLYGGKILQIGNNCFCTFTITVKQASPDWISCGSLPVRVGTDQNIGSYGANGVEMYIRGNVIQCAGGTAGQIECASVWYPAET